MPSASSQRNEAPSNDWIREHYPRIHRAAWVMTGDAWEAEDLAQETFLVALDKWQRFEGRSADTTWLFGILLRLRQRRNRTLMRMRRRLQIYIERHQPRQQSQDPQNVLSEEQWRESIWAEVAKLPRLQRDAVTLRFANELSYDEIALIVGCPSGTAKTRVHHGLKRLRMNSHCENNVQLDQPMIGSAIDTAPRSL